MASPTAVCSSRWRIRLAWLVAFWIADVAAMAVLAVLLRWLMRLAGLAT